MFDAVRALLDPAGTESLATLVDWRRWGALLGNTAVVCGGAVVTAGAVGGVLGMLATRTDMPGGRLLLGAALFGACLPVYVSTIFFLSLIPGFVVHQSSLASGFLYGLAYTPLATLVLAATFRAADRDLEEQALLDADRWSVLWRVTIPQAGWGLAVTGILVVLLVATDFTIPATLMVRTFAEEIYSQYQLDHRRAGPVLTAVPVLIVLAVLLVTVQLRYRVLGEHSPWQFGARPWILTLGRRRIWVGVACGLVIVVGLAVPTVALLMKIKTVANLWTAITNLHRELLVSALLAAAGATLVAAPAAGLAWKVAHGGGLRWANWAAVVLLLATPAPVVGISLIKLLNRPGPAGWLYDSPLVVVIGYFVRFLPIGVLLLLPALRRVPRELELAARVDGCDWLGVQRHVYWPAVIADVAVVWLVVVILCFAEVSATVLLAPPGWATASVRAFTLIHHGIYHDLAVLALLSMVFILLPWGLLAWYLRRALAQPRRTA